MVTQTGFPSQAALAMFLECVQLVLGTVNECQSHWGNASSLVGLAYCAADDYDCTCRAVVGRQHGVNSIWCFNGVSNVQCVLCRVVS